MVRVQLSRTAAGIDLIGARRRDVVWHGTAEGRLSADMLREASTAVPAA